MSKCVRNSALIWPMQERSGNPSLFGENLGGGNGIALNAATYEGGKEGRDRVARFE